MIIFGFRRDGKVIMNQFSNRKMKDWIPTERPYEKCERFGVENLTDAELLAIILQTGTKEYSVLELSQRVLEKCPEPNFAGLACMSFKDLTAIYGIGRVKALKLQVITEISKRMSQTNRAPKLQFRDPAAIAGYYMQKLRFLDVEQVYVLFFDTKCNFLGDKLMTIGTVNSSLVSPREIFMEAVERQAVYLVMLHNHPSGDPEASNADIQITERVFDTGKMLDIQLLDHIIIGDNRYFSFKESGCYPFS